MDASSVKPSCAPPPQRQVHAAPCATLAGTMTCGGSVGTQSKAALLLVPPGPLTASWPVPSDGAGGATSCSVVSSTAVKGATGWPPMATDVAPVKPLPLTVSVVPPRAGTAGGATAVTCGAGGGAMASS